MPITCTMTGMVLTSMPVGEYDRRITVLTKERGKITAFARGARRQGSMLAASTGAFAFGQFEVYEGRSSYTLVRAEISNYFRDLLADFDSVYYGFYFLEIADYYTRENGDELMMLKLLYQSMRALESKAIPNRLVRRIYELKAMVINGEYPNVFSCVSCGKREHLVSFSESRRGVLCADCESAQKGGNGAANGGASMRRHNDGAKKSGALPQKGDILPLEPSTLYTLQYIISTPIEKLYTFTVSDQVAQQLENIIERQRQRAMDRSFRSLEVLEENLDFADGNRILDKRVGKDYSE